MNTPGNTRTGCRNAGGEGVRGAGTLGGHGSHSPEVSGVNTAEIIACVSEIVTDDGNCVASSLATAEGAMLSLAAAGATLDASGSEPTLPSAEEML